jgi:formylglycine-generating enzyme required for sulfatase activity
MGCPPTDGWCDSNAQPVHNVTLSAFELDRYEVTAAQYEACVAAGACTPAGSGSSATSGVAGKENHPINEVSWHQAEAYCQWRGMRLPTEAEWERAAKGTVHRRFPWGDDCPMIFDANHCEELNWDQSPAKANCSEARCFDSFAQTAPVGSFPEGVSPEGVHDLAGNVFEWVADWYDPSYYSASPATDPAGPSSGSYRVARGGSHNNYGSALRTTVRNSYAPSHTASNLGFRCAR